MNMIIVYKVSDRLKDKMIEYYQDKCREKHPPYSIFQADDADTTIILYESGKVMFQGISADIDAKMWAEVEKKLTGKNINIDAGKEKLEKDRKKRENLSCLDIIGSDEVGIGDFFGPIVVTATYVSKKNAHFVEQIGARDSKTITDEKIVSIAPKLIKEIPHVTKILTNKEYNEYQKRGYNMNKIKAILHNEVLYKLKEQGYHYDKIIVDQFVYKEKYFEHLKYINEKVEDITFLTKAESLSVAVATASCRSRYYFLKEMAELSNKMKMYIPKGAGENVDKVTAEIVKKYGENKLHDIAKCNFKNMEKYKLYLKSN